MSILIVLAHPLPNSLSHRLAARVQGDLRRAGHDVRVLDLYQDDYDPVLSQQERACYYSESFEDVFALRDLTGIVLVFPTWWYGMPAILKGWIDRSFLPGVAYQHDAESATLHPNLPKLRGVLAVTTLGAPAWVDYLVLRRPVWRSLKWGVVRPCAPNACTRLCALYKAERVTPNRLSRFEARMSKTAARLFPPKETP